MQRRLRQACTALREHGAVSYARMAAAGGFGGVDMIVTRATSPSDVPLHEKYAHKLLKVFSIAGQASLRRFSLSFTRRFGRTKSWRVALKCLVLLHRLLRSSASSEISAHFRSELLWSKTNRLISLHPCRFRDESSANSYDYTAFVRSYAHFLDEALICTSFMLDHKQELVQEEEGREKISLPEKMKEVGRVLELLPQLQSLIDRVMECHPEGPAARSFLVKSAMKSIVRDSFAYYGAFRREISVVLDNLFQIPYSSCVNAFGVYKKESVQADKLCEFYDWCKKMGLCGLYEYPFVERIPVLQIRALESFLNEMWQFTESEGPSSSSASPQGASSSVGSRSSLTEDDRDRVDGTKGEEFGKKLVVKSKFCVEEEEPLIQLEDEGDDENESWETLLEASVNMSPLQQSISNSTLNSGPACGNYTNTGFGGQRDERNMMMMIYNPNSVNPFDQPWMVQDHSHGYCSAFNFAYSRGA